MSATETHAKTDRMSVTETMSKRKMRVRLGRKVVRGMCLFGAVLMIAVTLVVLDIINDWSIEEYSRASHAAARTVSECIDGDVIAGYLETGVKDEYYKRVQHFMDIVRRDQSLEFLYVFVPYEDHYVYIWDAYMGDQSQHDDLGTTAIYMQGFQEVLNRVYRRDPVEKLVYNRDQHVAMAFTPVFNGQGEPVALVGADFSLDEFRTAVIAFVIRVVLCIITVLMIFVLFFYFRIRKTVVNPVLRLSRGAEEIVEHLEEETERFVADIHTGDEIEELGHNLEIMEAGLHDYLAEVRTITTERERITAELDIARKIQAAMLPRVFPPFPGHTEFDLCASMTPAKEVGGDFYDFFLIDDDHLALVMADVSGKGVPAALYMAVSKSLIKNHAMLGGKPEDTLVAVNDLLSTEDDTGMFVTVWLGVLTISTGEIVSANAGHEYPAICRNGETYSLMKSKHGPPLGIFEDVSYEEEHFTLNTGDTLFLYTDGLPEATDKDKEMLGEERMVAALNECRNSDAKEYMEKMKSAADAFVGDSEPFDDLTMLAIRILK